MSSLERELRAAAPRPPEAFVERTLHYVRGRTADNFESRWRVGLAVALTALVGAAVLALGAPAYVRAAVTAVAQTTQSAVSATTSTASNTNGSHGGGEGDGGNNGGGGHGDDNENDGHSCHDGHTDNDDDDDDDCGGGSGGGQYGHGVPICHKTGSATNPWVLIVVPLAALPAHWLHGDIIPAPPGGCPGPPIPGAHPVTIHVTHAHLVASAGGTENFDVTVTSSFGVPAGAISCSDNGVNFDSATVFGGVAGCTDPLTIAGLHSITVYFIPTVPTLFQSATATGQLILVTRAASTTTVTTSGSPVTPGTPVTFTAHVARNAVTGPTPTGTVQFLDGSTPIGAPVTLVAGNATLTTSTLFTASHTISAAYTGDGTYAVSVGTVTQVVAQVATSTSVVSNHNPAVPGSAVTFTATVDPADSSTATGTVTFKSDGAAIGTVTLNGAGQAALTTSALSLGTHTITATYNAPSGGAWLGSAGTLSQSIAKIVTTTNVVTNHTPALPGTSVTFTATVTAVDSSTPTGAVTFKSDGVTIGTASLSSGHASLSTSALSLGTHTISAAYAGSGNWNTSSDTLSQVIAKVVTTTGVVTNHASALLGTSVSFTATVTAADSSTPAGTVTFQSDGSTIGTGTLSGGHASLTTTSLPAGTHTITASYPGTATLAASSGTVSQVITKPTATTTSAAASDTTPKVSVSITVTATVKVGSAPMTTGTVTFSVDGSAVATVAVNGSGVASRALSWPAKGKHTVTTTFNPPSTSFAGSNDSVDIDVKK